MKQILKIGILLFAAVWMFNSSAQAQKFGYLNSAEILSLMPEVKQMRSNLEVLQTQLQKQGEKMVTAYQTKEKDAMQKKERGELSPVQEEKALADLQAEQSKIMKFEQEMQQKLGQKEQELLAPILEKINNAIKEVAKEKELQFIFDTSTGAILYADETQDVSGVVKTKLGI